jgi:hypothetical protein
MRLDRNTTNPKRGKYALLKLRTKIKDPEEGQQVQRAVDILIRTGVLDLGNTPDTDFFVIRLKDKYAGPALHAYAEVAKADDLEYAAEVDALAQAADRMMPKRMPD